jgi:hypothetical protein
MVLRKREGALTKDEQRIVKALLEKSWRNQDIQALLNIGRTATVNSARITEVKADGRVKPALHEEVEFFKRKKESYDPKTGLNPYDDERLIRAREAMVLAVQIFNNPSLQFKTEVFSVLANIAWTYLLHEFYVRKSSDIFDKNGRSLLLSQMIERRDFPLSKGIKNNLAYMIGIRNDVEHKLLSRSDQLFFPKLQACCLNFDKALTTLFSPRLSLQHELSLALQFAKLDFDQITTFQSYDIPEQISALNSHLDSCYSEEEKKDMEYQFRIIYTFTNSNMNAAHIQFVRPESAEGKDIRNILEKRVISDDLYPLKPKQVCDSVSKGTKIKFTINNHSRAVRYYKVKQSKGGKQPENTDKKYCIYHRAHKDYTYSQAWVDYLISRVSDSEELAKIRAVRLS